jgi:hypothetical protein
MDSKKNRFPGLRSRISTVMITACLVAAAPANLPGIRNVVVFRESGRYGGWPANHGIWIWGNEVLVGFEAGYFLHSENRHSINWDKPAAHMLARSLDGGETWTLEKPPSLRAPDGMKMAGVPTEPGGKPMTDCPGGIDFTAPGFIMTVRMEDIHVGPSRFYYSYDKGKTWSGPYRVPNFGQKGIAARTDYLVNGKHDLTMFLTAAKSNGKQGHAICVRTKDGGKTWNMISFLGPEPAEDDKAIMPSSVRLSPQTIVTALRHPSWIDLYRTDDDGKNWRFVSKAIPDTGAHNGNPPSMVRLRDGRMAITYGYRSEPFGIRARISKDNGETWSNEIVLRADGGTWDLGYTRTVQRADGKMLTVYYFNDTPDTERYIGATIWDPDQVTSK